MSQRTSLILDGWNSSMYPRLVDLLAPRGCLAIVYSALHWALIKASHVL